MAFRSFSNVSQDAVFESISRTYSSQRIIFRDAGGLIPQKHNLEFLENNQVSQNYVDLRSEIAEEEEEDALSSRTVSPEPINRTPVADVVDLMTDSESDSDSDHDSGFHNDDYLSDEALEELLKTWNVQPEFARDPTLPPRSDIPWTTSNGVILKPGMSVELAEGGFLRISRIVRDHLGVFLQGKHFVKLVDLPNFFPHWTQEVCWVVRKNEDGHVVSEKEVPVTSVSRTIRLIMLNRPRLARSRIKCPIGTFLCRLQWASISNKGELMIRHLTPDEADEQYRTQSSILRQRWRGNSVPFGSDTVNGRRYYSFGDGFCGAGGISSGAKAAGLHVKWSFDYNAAALQTYRDNFPDTTCHLSGFDHFMTNPSNEIQVDVSHTSPPCQTWSPAHTVTSDKDDDNSALIFSSCNLIPKVKPRIHTIEQTSGLPERFKQFYHWVIRDTLELGYSVHTKVVNCLDYGVPQTRKRLVFIAAG